MIAITIILLLSSALIAGLVMFWKNILTWIKKALNKIKEVLHLVPEGTRTFIARTREGFKNKSKYYYQNKITGEWEEAVYTKEVAESEVPLDILAKARHQTLDVDISTTEELKLAISA